MPVDPPVQPPNHVCHQRYPRVPFSTRVVRYDDSPASWSSVNMSAGGLFVEGGPFLSPGTELEVGLWLPDDVQDGREIISRARVVWTNDPNDPDSIDDVPAGMGMELIDLDPVDRRLLQEKLYDSASWDSAVPLDDDDIVEVGAVVGAYRILDLLGSGGMGDVYLAEHLHLERRVALKRLHRRHAVDPDAVERFFAEGRAVNRIRHDNVLEITDFFTEGADSYYVMELLQGMSLAQALARDGAMPIARLLRIAAQICDGLQAVHDANVIHRDLKPGNVFLTKKGNGVEWVTLLDFGVAKLSQTGRGARRQTVPGMAIGTPAYMAPEQAVGADIDARTDIYALGVLMYEMVTGKRLFRAHTFPDLQAMHLRRKPPRPSKVRQSAVPRALDNLILLCLAKRPSRRPRSAADVAAALRSIASLPAIYGDAVPQPPAWITATDPTSPLPMIALRHIRAAVGAAPFRFSVVIALTLSALAAATAVVTLTGMLAETPGAKTQTKTMRSASPVSMQLPAPELLEAERDDSPALESRPSMPRGAARKRSRRSPVSKLRHTEKLMKLAKNYVEGGDHLKAIKVCHEALRIDPNNARAYRTLGISYSLTGAVPQACEAYRRYALLRPHAPDRRQVFDIIRRCP